ncbi:MAG: Sbal_3080 family lipoprotein [Sedimenticola sp.]
MFKKMLVMSCAILVASGCSITQNVEPAQLEKQTRLCIIENKDVREGFVREFQAVLSSKGIKHTLVDERSVNKGCVWTATYVANWTWDLALYMSYAEIKVFHKGRLDGKAVYDSRWGAGNMNKFIDAEPKIRELVNELMQVKEASLFYRYFG